MVTKKKRRYKRGAKKQHDRDDEEEDYEWPLAGKSWEFKGETCLSDFITTFIDRQFSDCTFLAHNSKGYDGYLAQPA